MDRKIQDAIRQAVADAGQDPGLARKLESWFEAIASGSEDISDRQSSYRHLEFLYDDTHVSAIRRSPFAGLSLDEFLDDDTNGGETA